MEQVEGCYGCRMLARRVADAQATIAALRAEVKDLKEWLAAYKQSIELAQSSLTQRTAELEAANKLLYRKNCALGRAETIINDLQAELERVRGALVETKEVEAALSSKVAEYEVELNGDPQNFYGRGRTVGLRTLIAALPKVEGEIAVKRTEVDLSDVWGITLNGYFTFQSALFDGKEEAESYAAILKHRQGMEG